MPSHVPTYEEFDALKERVAALETTPPPVVEPEPVDYVTAIWTSTGLEVSAQFGIYRGPVTLRDQDGNGLEIIEEG